ncbi:hypothetical protein [Kitasatospora sp. NPDC059827]|uniref:hypothetical protein n=1 Tax=Kitasatospora sp. NPDC059827 TaxID=3346964 RepID=UPI0036608851
MEPFSHPDSPLAAAFPAEFAGDARRVLEVMPNVRLRPSEPFAVVVRGETLSIPSRIHHDEVPQDRVAHLSPRQRQLLHCLYSRHHDGRVRQLHLARIVGSGDDWVVPFVVQLAGEYVVEILTDIRDALRGLDDPGSRLRRAYGEFIVANPAYFDRTQRRVVSYWSCYYRGAYASFRGYPGSTLLDALRCAAADSAGRPWPGLAPKGATRLDGYC